MMIFLPAGGLILPEKNASCVPRGTLKRWKESWRQVCEENLAHLIEMKLTTMTILVMTTTHLVIIMNCDIFCVIVNNSFCFLCSTFGVL